VTAESATVLVVEDEGEIRSLIREVLQIAGYRVLEASDRAQALKLADAHPGGLDLMVLDLKMPGLSTADLVGRIRTARPDTRVLYISGQPHEDVVAQSGPLPPGAFLQKPFTVVSLTETVRRILGA
jgi:two-component system, cell cycle sensor histidine kinase and response regulator CckA